MRLDLDIAPMEFPYDLKCEEVLLRCLPPSGQPETTTADASWIFFGLPENSNVSLGPYCLSFSCSQKALLGCSDDSDSILTLDLCVYECM